MSTEMAEDPFGIFTLPAKEEWVGAKTAGAPNCSCFTEYQFSKETELSDYPVCLIIAHPY